MADDGQDIRGEIRSTMKFCYATVHGSRPGKKERYTIAVLKGYRCST